MTGQNTKRYAYEHLEAVFNDWSNKMQNEEVTRAIRKLKFMVLAYAWVDFCIWSPGNDNEQAISWAWEDLSIALAGYGQSAMTGTVIDIWTSTPKDSWEELRKVLNSGIAKAEAETSNIVSRRYLQRYRGLACRSPKDGFDLPSVVPAWGPRLREWASKMGMDPDATEEQMRYIEEYERMGLIEVGGELRVVQTPGEEGAVLPGAVEQAEPEPEADNVISFEELKKKPRKKK